MDANFESDIIAKYSTTNPLNKDYGSVKVREKSKG